jgi:hypothetical protein
MSQFVDEDFGFDSLHNRSFLLLVLLLPIAATAFTFCYPMKMVEYQVAEYGTACLFSDNYFDTWQTYPCTMIHDVKVYYSLIGLPIYSRQQDIIICYGLDTPPNATAGTQATWKDISCPAYP